MLARVAVGGAMRNHAMGVDAPLARSASVPVVAKGPRRDRPVLPAVELICAELARLTMPSGIRVPPVMYDPERNLHLSRLVDRGGAEPLALLAADQERAAAVVAFDAWVLNPDRSKANVLATDDGTVWLIDHCCCLGAEAGPGELALLADAISPTGASPREGTVVGGSCVTALVDDAEALLRWADRMGELPDGHVVAVVDLARAHGALPDDHADAIVGFLLHRKGRVRELLAAAIRAGHFAKMDRRALEGVQR